MGRVTEHIEALRQLARTVHRISEVSVPELTVIDDMLVEKGSGDDRYELEQDENWWNAWCEIHEIVEGTMGNAKVGETNIRPDVQRKRQYDEIRAKTDWTSLSVAVYADGDVRMLAKYDRGDNGSWDVLYDQRLSVESPDPVEVGREVASAELAVLASKTQSCADTLDYWQTKMAPKSFKQRRWAGVRGVGRQTINDRIRSASTAMIRDFGPSELHDALNEVESGDMLDFAFITGDTENVTGGGVFRVSESVEPFGDGTGHIRCENDVDEVVTDIREMEREDDGRVAIEQDGELTHVGGYVTVE